jgi:hypothetical protein
MARGRYICEVHVTFSRILIPAKHGINSCRKLGRIRLINTTSVYLEVLKTVFGHLISTKLDLFVASLTLPIFTD